MILKDYSFKNSDDNIVYDEVLLHLAEQYDTGDILRFWESPEYFVVLGRIGKVEEEINRDAVKQDNIKVIRRCSGGGTVLQGPGCLNYSFILSKDRTSEVADLKGSYQFILSKIVKALKKLNIDAKYLPISDIAFTSTNKKFSGNAQKRSRTYILHHGTLMYHFDLALITKYLSHPKIMPDYRQNREHLEFVDNLNVAAEQLKDSLSEEFLTQRGAQGLSNEERLCLEELKSKKEEIFLSI